MRALKIITLLGVVLLLNLSTFAQSAPPQAISFTGKAMLNGIPITSPFSIKVEIWQINGNIKWWSEIHNGVTPDQNGNYNIKIGQGIQVISSQIFGLIPWNESLELEVSFDPTNQNSFSQSTSIPFLTVPYAFYAEESGGGSIAGGQANYLLKYISPNQAVKSQIYEDNSSQRVNIGPYSSDLYEHSFVVNATQTKGSGFTNSVVSSQTRAIDAELRLGNVDAAVIEARNIYTDYYGFGGAFLGGWKGLIGQVNPSGNAYYTGVYGKVNGGGTNKTGYGVYGHSVGQGSNYGVYGSASGGTLNYSGYFEGNVLVTGTFTNISDKKFKKNIKEIENSLPLIMKLKPKTYSFDTRSYMDMNLPVGSHYGFVAQELEEIFPSLVSENIQPAQINDKKEKISDEIKFKSVNYIELITIVVSAMQEQQAEIELLKAEIETLNKRENQYKVQPTK